MIVDIDRERILNFDNHPFKIIDDEIMQSLISSIINNGILTPLLVRPKDKYYEIISGHRRKYVADIKKIYQVNIFDSRFIRISW